MFITKFSNQHWARSIQKYWRLLSLGGLRMLKVLWPPSCLKDEFCRIQNIHTFLNMIVSFKCKLKRCKACHFMCHNKKTFLRGDRQEFSICCSIQFVVYGLRCPCGLYFIGQTVRMLRTRFGEHRHFIEHKHDKHSIPRHFVQVHNGSTEGLERFRIEAIPMSIPEGESFSRLCAR